MFFPETLVDWVSIVAGIATAILVVFVAWEFRLLRNEQNARLRPEIGIVDIRRRRLTEGEEIRVILKNYGLTTAKKFQTKIATSLGKPLTDEEIDRMEYDIPIVVVPNQDVHTPVTVTGKEYQGMFEDRDRSKMLFIRFNCQYFYANDKKASIDLVIRFEQGNYEIESFKSTG